MLKHKVHAIIDQGWIRLECFLHDDFCEFNDARHNLGTLDLAECIIGTGQFPLLVVEDRDDPNEPSWLFKIVTEGEPNEIKTPT